MLWANAGALEGQAEAYNLSRDVLGEARLIERALGIGASALAEVLTLLNHQLHHHKLDRAGADGITAPLASNCDFATEP